MKEYLEFKDDKSSKFWSIELNDKSFTVVYGKIGAAGKADSKSFASATEAEKEANKLLNSKLKKGYVRAAAPAATQGAEPKVSEKKKAEPKQQSTVTPPKDAIDNGKQQTWQTEEGDFWKDGYFDEESFANIRTQEDAKPAAKGSEKDTVGEEYDQTEHGRHIVKMEDSGRFARLDEFLKELELVKQHTAMAEQVENYMATHRFSPQDHYRYNLTSTLKWVFDTNRLQKEHIKIVEVLLTEGANFESVAKEEIDERIGDDFWDERIHPLWMNFVERYRKNPDPTQTATYFDEFLTDIFKKSADVALNLLQNLITDFKNGKHPKFKGQKTLPPEIRGFRLHIHDYNKVIVYGIKDDGHISFAEEDLKGIDDFDSSLVSIYALDYLQTQFNETIDKTALDSISSGIMQVDVEGVKDSLYKSKTQTFDIILDERVKLLESTEEWSYVGLLDEAVYYLVYTIEDADRALNLIKRFLYSGNCEAEDIAHDVLCKYDSGNHRTAWWFERALYWWKNMDYEWSLRTIKEYALDEKYPPAVAFYEQLLAEGIIPTGKKGKESSDKEEKDSDYYTREFGYGSQAEVQEFLDKFTEEDKFRETDNVIMRAQTSGSVYIQFKQETEKAYEEALDFLLHIIGKGYVKIFDGYQLCVRFVSKPEFIPQIRLPKTQCNAFFARAVRYESLHEKIRQYVLNGMKMFDRYHDLQEEDCTIVGAFAASALALADKKHTDLAIKYGKESDGEHEEIQLELAHSLEKVHGVDKDTAPAIYELTISYDHEEYKVSDIFYKDPEVLEAFTQYLNEDNSHFKDSKIVRFLNCMIPKGSIAAKMKALKAFYDAAPDARVKNIYADFYNLVIDSDAALKYRQLSLEPLEYAETEGRKKEKATGLAVNEQVPVVISAKEAEKRNLGDKGFEIDLTDGRYACIFSPSALTDPRFIELLISDHRKRCKREVFNKISPTGSSWNSLFLLDNKWMIDLSVAPYQYGIFIYNGKDKPVVLYGALKYADLLLKVVKRKVKEEDVEALMEQYAIPGIETPPGSPVVVCSELPAQAFMEEIRSGMFDKKFNNTLINIEKIKPEDGEYYKSAQVFKAYILNLKQQNAKKYNLTFEKDREELLKLYGELQILLPEHNEYWQEKMAKLL